MNLTTVIDKLEIKNLISKGMAVRDALKSLIQQNNFLPSFNAMLEYFLNFLLISFIFII